MPLRKARLMDPPQMTTPTDRIGQVQARFDLVDVDDTINDNVAGPETGMVISLWNFADEGITLNLPAYPGGYPSGVSSAFVDDHSELVAGPNAWQIHGHEHAPANISEDGLYLPNYQGDSAFSNSAFQCSDIWNIEGDFTIELRHNPLNHGYVESSSPVILASSLQPGPDNIGLEVDGEWLLKNIYDGIGYPRSLTFGFRDGGVAYTVGGGEPYPNAVNEIAVVREGSVLRMFLNGELVQTTTGVGTGTISTQRVTIGSRQDGGHYLPNDYGTGMYTGWRVTQGRARYSENYDVGADWTLDGTSLPAGPITLPSLSAPSWGTDGGEPLFQFKPNFASPIQFNYDRVDYENDFSTGPFEVIDPSDQSRINQRFSLMLRGREEVFAFRRFLGMARGRAVRFYVPSFTQSLVPLGATVGGDYIECKPAGFVDAMSAFQQCRIYVAIVFKNENTATIYRTISTRAPCCLNASGSTKNSMTSQAT